MTAGGGKYPVTLTSYSLPEGRYHNPLNPLNLLNPLNPHAAGVSKGDTTPFEPSETFEPSEPGPRSGLHSHLFSNLSLAFDDMVCYNSKELSMYLK